MKLGRFLYLLAIVIMAIMSGVMFYHEWKVFGFLTAIMTISGLLVYSEIIDNSKEYATKLRKSRRKTYFSEKRREQYYKFIQEQLEEQLKTK